MTSGSGAGPIRVPGLGGLHLGKPRRDWHHLRVNHLGRRRRPSRRVWSGDGCRCRLERNLRMWRNGVVGSGPERSRRWKAGSDCKRVQDGTGWRCAAQRGCETLPEPRFRVFSSVVEHRDVAQYVGNLTRLVYDRNQRTLVRAYSKTAHTHTKVLPKRE